MFRKRSNGKPNGAAERILQMLAKGKITVEEAERLLDALPESDGDAGGSREQRSASGQASPRFLRVLVDAREETEAEIWLRLWMHSKNFCQGHAIEEFIHAGYLDVDGELLGCVYAANEKMWQWALMGRAKLSEGTHVIGVGMGQSYISDLHGINAQGIYLR